MITARAVDGAVTGCGAAFLILNRISDFYIYFQMDAEEITSLPLYTSSDYGQHGDLVGSIITSQQGGQQNTKS